MQYRLVISSPSPAAVTSSASSTSDDVEDVSILDEVEGRLRVAVAVVVRGGGEVADASGAWSVTSSVREESGWGVGDVWEGDDVWLREPLRDDVDRLRRVILRLESSVSVVVGGHQQ